MLTPITLWLTVFQQSPATAWDDVVFSRSPIPGYERADIAETLYMVFGGLPADDPLKNTLDATLTAWIDPFLAWNIEQRRSFGFSRYIHWIVEVFAAASLLRLNGFRQHTFKNFRYYQAILAPLQLAPQRDPLAAMYRSLAGSAEYAPQLKDFWLRLSREADHSLPKHYLDIGLLGLRQCSAPKPGSPPP